MRINITAARLLTPFERIDNPFLVVEDEHVSMVQSREAAEVPQGRILEFPGMVLAPGLIDIHIHGGAGHDVMEGDDAALSRIEHQLVAHGVTAYLPTTVTASQERTLKALDQLAKAVAAGKKSSKRAVPLGIHLEGPFINHEKRGVHPPNYLAEPSPQALERLWQAAAGTIRMLTIAPELPGAVETIRYARTLGVQCSLGHSNATYEEAIEGIGAGAHHATHTFNAMRALEHRDPGILGAVFEHDDLTADIIADGIHVHPSVVKLFLRAKGEERAILITDAISATGMPEGTYKLGSFEVQVKGGRCEHEGRLAGSVLTLDRAVRNAIKFAELRLDQAVRMATANPAKLFGFTNRGSFVAPGCRADLVVLTPAGQVVNTIVGGETAHD
jgi:N-acetylglucosamine-6-phosphate deacetylase